MSMVRTLFVANWLLLTQSRFQIWHESTVRLLLIIFCNRALLPCLWQHFHCCPYLSFVAGGGDWKRGESKINGFLHFFLIEIWKDNVILGSLFRWWIDLIDNLPLNIKQGPIYETTEVCVQLFCCRYDTDCLQRREDSPSWTAWRTSIDEMPVQERESWLCFNIVHVM